MKRLALPMIMLLSLTACTTVPPVQILEVCPKLPDLEMIPQDVLERSFTEKMQQFLQGSHETPTSYELPSSNVRLSTTK